MIKNVLIIMATLFLSTIWAGKVVACEGPYCEKEFTIFRIVGSEGSKVQKTTFGWDETPWVYIKIDDKKDKVSTSWLDNLGETFVTKWAKVNKNGKAWISLADWNNVKETGKWTVSGFIKNDYDVCPVSASFVVTPEPISMVLYGLGGLPLAAHFLRRRKQI